MALDASSDQPVPSPDRSRRICVYWGIGLAFLAALALFCWLVVAPVLRVRGLALELGMNESSTDAGSFWRGLRVSIRCLEPSATLDRLGGRKRAVGAIGLYLRLPGRLAPRREAAARLLAFCGPPAIPALLRGIADADAAVARNAAFSLVELAAEAGEPVWATAQTEGNPTAWPAVPELVRMVRENPRGRGGVAGDVLRAIRPPARDIEPLLRDSDPTIRGCAASVLATRWPDTKSILKETALKDSDPRVRGAALAAWDDAYTKVAKEDVPMLVECLKDSSAEIRSAACWLIGRLGSDAREAEPALRKALEDADRIVRHEAAEALKKIREE